MPAVAGTDNLVAAEEYLALTSQVSVGRYKVIAE